MYPFFAMLSRMKYINRWGLMRNTRSENICEHSLEVALVAHALATIGNKKFGKSYDPQRAALLSSVSLEPPAHVVGRDTAECLQSGVLYGAAAMLDGLCDRMEEELGYPCRVVATGGLAGMVVPHCRRKVECSDTLLLDGLKVIYQWAGHESQS